LVYFLQARLQFQGGNIYTTALIGTSIPLGKIKVQTDWFKESYFGLWETNIQAESPVSIGWLLLLTNTINTDVLKQEISRFIKDILVGLHGKMITLRTQGKIPKKTKLECSMCNVNELAAML